MSSIESYWDLLKSCGNEYPPEAFEFVRLGLSHTAELIHGQHAVEIAAVDNDIFSTDDQLAPTDDEIDRHVSGQQLCMGLRDFAIKRYGLLARTVMTKWGVSRTDDFGNIVFAMIDAGLMRKSDNDKVMDFRSVFDFDEAFGPPDVSGAPNSHAQYPSPESNN